LELIGQTLDHYQVVEQLGDEFWGSNFMGYDLKFERKVVVQLLSHEWLERSRASDYTMQIARAMVNWRQPGIARVYDFGQISTSNYTVREFIPGVSLNQLLKTMRSQVKWISLPEAFLLIVEICRSLAYAHQRNIMHGDLYPGSIILKPNTGGELSCQPVLIDLGVVSPTALHLVPSLPAYQPPEATLNKKMEKSADVYSLGILLYELTTGQVPPVKGNPKTTAIDDRARQENGDTLSIEDNYISSKNNLLSTSHRIPYTEHFIPSPRNIRPDLPKQLEQVILKAIASNPEERYSDALSLKGILEELIPQIKQVSTSPPGFRSVISLATVLQTPISKEKGGIEPSSEGAPRSEGDKQPRVLIEKAIPTQGENDLSKDQIHILEPNQTLYSIPMEPTGITIGRGLENDLVIDHPSVSRYHARIDFDGNDYLVQDLKSLNGTYIEDTRLSPGAPHTWLPGENLRVGEIWLRVERAGQAITTQAVLHKGDPAQPDAVEETVRPTQAETSIMYLSPNGRTIDPSQVQLSTGEGWIGVFMEKSHFSVLPGDSVSATLLLFNRGSSTDTFRITSQGLPPEWIPSSHQLQRIPANGKEEVEITFRPPRSSEGKIGRHLVTLRISSHNAPDQAVELRLTLTVAGFSQFSSELQPKEIPAGQLGQVLVNNLGNLPETFTVTLEDKQHKLVFDPSQAKIYIPAGKSAIVEFRTSPIQQQWFGAEETHSFTAHVSSLSGQLQSHPGEIAIRGLIPFWAPIILTTLCLVMVCVFIMFYNQFTLPSRYSRRTAEVGQTSLALAYQYTAAAVTETSQSLAGANQATRQSVTATAVWGIADDDQDSLANSLEILAGTKPDNPDTDGDGLSDGEEVNRRKTNPLAADTDTDGLSDGREIEKGTDPLRKDTDDDGIMDSVDPDPLHAATKTPLIVPSASPTRSLTPTQTSTPTITFTPQLNLADLNISVTNGKATSVPGSNVGYTIKVKNKGPGAVFNAQVVDSFPSNITNLTWTCTATTNSRCQTPDGINNLDELVDLDVNGVVTFEIDGVLFYSATGLLINTANVNPPPGISDPNMVDNLAIDTDTISPQVSLSLYKTDGRSTIAPGELLTYTIGVTNSGPSSVNAVNIRDDFSNKMTNITWTCNPSPGSSCQAIGVQNGDINTFANLLPGGSTRITARGTVKTSATGILSNSAFIFSPIDPTNNDKKSSDTTTIVPESELLLEVITPFTVSAHSPITYTIYITNTGPSNASVVTLNQTLPPGATFISASPTSPVCEALADEVTCTLGDLLVSSRKKVVIIINSPATPGTFVSQIEVDSKESDPNPANNSTSSTVQVQ